MKRSRKPASPYPDPWKQRLRAAIDALGLSLKEVSRRAGHNETLVQEMLSKPSNPRVDTLAAVCKVVGKSLSEIFDGTDRVHLAVKVLGVTTGADMWAEVPMKHSKVVPFELFSQEIVTVEISDENLTPRFDRGDIISGPRVLGPHLDNLIGSDCIIELKDGSKKIGILLRGASSGLFTLRSLNPRAGDLRDVPIQWAAPIRMILRGKT